MRQKDFDDIITGLRPLYNNDIAQHYGDLYMQAISRLLNLLGTKDGEWFTLEPHTGNRSYRGVHSAHRAIRYVTEEHGNYKLPCLEVDNIGSPYRKEGVERLYIIDHNLSMMGFWYEYLRNDYNYKKRKKLL